jgi:hypothetical protein
MKLSCKEASRLISLSLDRKLTFGQRTALRLHLALCDACTRVKTQFDFLRRAVARYSGTAESGEDPPGRKR